MILVFMIDIERSITFFGRMKINQEFTDLLILRMASISPDLIEKDQRKTGNLLDYYVSDRNAF